MFAAEREVPSSGETGAQDPAPAVVPLPVVGGRRSETINRKELRRDLRLMERDDEADLAELRALRPKVRGDCQDGERACPWVSCKHHLYLDVTEAGSLKMNFPSLEVWELAETCALDVADRGGITLQEVGAFANVTRERIRQVERSTLAAAKRAIETMEETVPVPTSVPTNHRDDRYENEQLLRIEALLRKILQVLEGKPTIRPAPALPAPVLEAPPPEAPPPPDRRRDPATYVRLDTVVEFIRARGSARSRHITEGLGMSRGAAEVALAKLTKQGRLYRLDVGLYAVTEAAP